MGIYYTRMIFPCSLLRTSKFRVHGTRLHGSMQLKCCVRSSALSPIKLLLRKQHYMYCAYTIILMLRARNKPQNTLILTIGARKKGTLILDTPSHTHTHIMLNSFRLIGSNQVVKPSKPLVPNGRGHSAPLTVQGLGLRHNVETG